MATITIRQLDEKTKTRLMARAVHHGRSMEKEAKEILRSALTASSPIKGNLAETITDDLRRLADSTCSCRDAMLCAGSASQKQEPAASSQ